jgi:hypothetical protein
MRTAAETWSVLQELSSTLAGQYGADLHRAVEEAWLAREPVGVLLRASDIHPRPLTVAHLMHRAPYSAAVTFTAPLVRLAAGGWLEALDSGGYRLTPKGLAATNHVSSAVRDRLERLAPLPPADLERLARLVLRLTEASQAGLAGVDPAERAASDDTVSLSASGALVAVAHALEALTHFHTDTQRTAWRAAGLDGPTWETVIWLGDELADSAASLFEWSQQPPHPRAWGAPDYAACLETLAARGWAAPGEGDRYHLTAAGRSLRQGVENQADAYFFGPWHVLTQPELDDLYARARAVIQGLSGA